MPRNRRLLAFPHLKAVMIFPEVARYCMNSLSILVADDEDSIRSLLEHFLKTHGHTVMVASNAREACEAMPNRNFDLVITDVLMPEGDGLDLITELRKVQPRARILAMSGGGRYLEGSDYLKLARGLGAHHAMMKPFTWQQLQEAIQIALNPSPDGESPAAT